MEERHDGVLRWIRGDAAGDERTLSEAEFILEVLGLAERDGGQLRLEPMLIERLGGPERCVEWRAYVRSSRELFGLARQLAAERCLRLSGSGGKLDP